MRHRKGTEKKGWEGRGGGKEEQRKNEQKKKGGAVGERCRSKKE